MSFAESVGPKEVEHPDGSRVRLSTLWEDTTVVLVFLRHFG